MSKMAPRESMVDYCEVGRKQQEKNDELLIIIKDSHKSKEVDEKKKIRKRRRKMKDMWENDQFIQIKSIQKTQDAMNKNLRQLQLDKMRITRNKRIEEASENIRRRRATLQQKNVLKDVLQTLQDNEGQLHDERNLNGIHNGEPNKENKLINNKDTQVKINNKDTQYSNISYIYNKKGNKDCLPPLVRTSRTKPFLPMASIRNTSTSVSSVDKTTLSRYTDPSNFKRSIVIKIPDINTDASKIQDVNTEASINPDVDTEASPVPKSAKELCGSDTSPLTGRSVKSASVESNRQRNADLQDRKSFRREHSRSARSKLGDLPPIKFTLTSIKGPSVSYIVDRDKMISYRPAYGVPVAKLPCEKSLSPTIMVSPRNSSISIPLVRKDIGRSRENLSIIGKNLALFREIPNHYNQEQAIGRVSSYNIRSSVSPVSSNSSTKTPPRHSMKGAKISKKRMKEISTTKSEYASSTGFVISEFSIQERMPKKHIVHTDKQSLHEFPNHVREKYIKKKLLLAQTERQDMVSWKVRKYITDPGTFSSTKSSEDTTTQFDVKSDIGVRKKVDDFVGSLPPNKKDISELLLRMLLKQSPRNQVQKERIVPSEERISSVVNSSTSTIQSNNDERTKDRHTGHL